MPENAGLLAVVLANPDEDGPRMDYASWCEDQEDEPTQQRAQFIRTQVEFASAALDPDRGASGRLLAEEERLLHRYGNVWGEPVEHLTQGYGFQRGFIELVALSGREFIEHSAELMSLAPVRHVDITELDQDDVEEFFQSPQLRQLRSLSMTHCGLDDSMMGMFATQRLEQLQWLDLGENRIGMEGLRTFAESARFFLPLLQFARFFGNPVDPTERISHDTGVIINRWLPEAGLQLEEDFGELPWLHVKGERLRDKAAQRFLVPVVQGA